MKLPPAVAGHQHKVVEFGGNAAHIEHSNVLPAVLVRRPRSGNRELQAALLAGFSSGKGIGDGANGSEFKLLIGGNSRRQF
jgi:hypothetical protein